MGGSLTSGGAGWSPRACLGKRQNLSPCFTSCAFRVAVRWRPSPDWPPAPFNTDMGHFRGRKTIRDRTAPVRSTQDKVALGSSRCDATLLELCERLLAKGRVKKTRPRRSREETPRYLRRNLQGPNHMVHHIPRSGSSPQWGLIPNLSLSPVPCPRELQSAVVKRRLCYCAAQSKRTPGESF